MPFIFLLFGLVLIISGYNGTSGKLFDLLKDDIAGTNGFGKWMFALFIIGAIGYVKPLKQFSDTFLFLVILVIVIANNNTGGGFFKNLEQVIRS